MEQRVRDLIYELRHFDPDIRVSEKTTLNFKYDGHATRLNVKCNSEDYEERIEKLNEANAKLEGVIEERDEDIGQYLKRINYLEEKVSKLEYDLKEARKPLEIIRGAL